MSFFEEFKAPDRTSPASGSKKIFLAGSIDMGEAENWQEKVVKELSELAEKTETKVAVLNPRRDDWDSSWEQTINNTQFFDQVSWELDNIEKCDVPVVYFAEDSKAPITFLELGEILGSGKKNPIVFCPEGFYRKGNVDIACYRKDVPVHTEFDSFMDALCKAINIERDTDTDTEEPVKEAIEESETVLEEIDDIITIKSFFDNPDFSYSKGDLNKMVVEDFESIENSCMMSHIKFKGRDLYLGLCNEEGSNKVKLKIQRPDNIEESMVFVIEKADENNPEGIILSE